MERLKFETVRDLFKSFAERNKPGRSVAAHIERCRNRAEFVDYAGMLRIDDLIPDDLEGWIESHADWESDWTRLRIANTIKRPFNWAVRKGLISRNPFASVNYRAGARGKPISKTHFFGLVKGAPADLRQVLFFMSFTGIRPGELCDLEWSFIDAQNGTATLYTHKTSDSRLDRKPRVIILPAIALRLLAWIKRRQQPGEKHPFLNQRGNKMTRGGLDLRIWRLRKKLGISPSVKLYGVRHAWATDLAIARVDLLVLMELLGHTTLDMARYYVHLAGQNGHLRRELERGLNESRKS